MILVTGRRKFFPLLEESIRKKRNVDENWIMQEETISGKLEMFANICRNKHLWLWLMNGDSNTEGYLQIHFKCLLFEIYDKSCAYSI